jgi:hypothetical protein
VAVVTTAEKAPLLMPVQRVTCSIEIEDDLLGYALSCSLEKCHGASIKRSSGRCESTAADRKFSDVRIECFRLGRRTVNYLQSA